MSVGEIALFFMFFSMKKFTAFVILGSLFLASCSMNNPLKKESTNAPASDDAMMEKKLTKDDAMMDTKEDTMVKEKDTPSDDSMMKADVKVDAAM